MIEGAHDAQLIRRIATQDQAGLRGLYARHQTRVFRFLLRLVRQEAIAEELTNEVFLEAWRNAAASRERPARPPGCCRLRTIGPSVSCAAAERRAGMRRRPPR